MNPPRKRLDHETPYWVTENSDYFITICAEPRGRNHFCNDLVGPAILNSVRFYNERERWFCSIVLLMPDHVHMMICFPSDANLSRVVGLWKQGLARKHGISRQRNFFEHRLRNDENGQSKADYILHNPVRAKLVDDWKNGLISGCRTRTNAKATEPAAKDSGGYHEDLLNLRAQHLVVDLARAEQR